jgi:hypothetical protein
MIISRDVAGFFSRVFIFFLSSWQLVYIKFSHEYGAPEFDSFDELFKMFHSPYLYCLFRRSSTNQLIKWHDIANW